MSRSGPLSNIYEKAPQRTATQRNETNHATNFQQKLRVSSKRRVRRRDQDQINAQRVPASQPARRNYMKGIEKKDGGRNYLTGPFGEWQNLQVIFSKERKKEKTRDYNQQRPMRKKAKN